MTAPTILVRRGPSYWWQAFGWMIRFDLVRHRLSINAIVASQLFMGLGAAAMYGFYLGDVDPVTATFIVTGVAALALIPVGLLMIPVVVMQDRIAGTEEFTWTLPVPRLVAAASLLTIFTAIGAPIALLSTWVAALRFDVTLSVTWGFPVAAVLVAVMATSIGYGMANAIPEPRLISLMVNVIIFVALLFSPIVIPIELFPDWLASVHRVLPFFHMANVLRATLTEGLVTNVAPSWLVLSAWSVAGWAMASWVVGRRG